MVRMKSDKTINFAASHHWLTHRHVRKAAGRTGMRAKANLEQHRWDGDARIEVERGGRRLAHTRDVDLLVILSDERGLGAAMSIEFGREEGTTSSWGPMEATNILHDAAGLSGRGQGREKRRVREARRNKKRRKS